MPDKPIPSSCEARWFRPTRNRWAASRERDSAQFAGEGTRRDISAAHFRRTANPRRVARTRRAIKFGYFLNQRNDFHSDGAGRGEERGSGVDGQGRFRRIASDCGLQQRSHPGRGPDCGQRFQNRRPCNHASGAAMLRSWPTGCNATCRFWPCRAPRLRPATGCTKWMKDWRAGC